jgi:hypothetical protein
MLHCAENRRMRFSRTTPLCGLSERVENVKLLSVLFLFLQVRYIATVVGYYRQLFRPGPW